LYTFAEETFKSTRNTAELERNDIPKKE
jgi:hypothetical protein